MHFDARVQSLPLFIEALKCGQSRKQAKLISKSADVLLKQLKAAWPGKSDAVQRILFEQATEARLLGHVCIDRFGVLKELREFAREFGDELIEEEVFPPEPHPFAHLLNQGDADGMFLPIKFVHPLQLQVKGRNYPYPVGSGVALRQELEILNQTLRVEETFNLANLPEFIEASHEQIEKMEQTFGLNPSFWTKFGFVVLRRLNTIALENKLPVIFHYEQ